MSAEAAALVAAPTLGVATRDVEWYRQRARIFRFAFGMTLSAALAFGLAWPLAFITPVFTAKLLTTPKVLPVKAAVAFLVILGGSLFLASTFLLPTLAYPLIYLPLSGLMMFLLFYAKAGGTNPILVVFLLLGVLMMPILGTVSAALAIGVAQGLLFSAAVAIVMIYVTAALFPDPPAVGAQAPVAQKKAAAPDVPAPRERAVLALRSVAVLYPLATVVLLFSRTDLTLVLIQAGMLSLEPTFGKHLAAGKGLIYANLAAGLVAVAIYQMLLMVPSFPFFLLLVLLAGLWTGKWIFSDHPLGKLLSAGITAVFIILGPALTGDAEAGAELALRIFLIMFAVLYVVLAFGLLERLSRGRRVPA
jgi:hypothetical protein